MIWNVAIRIVSFFLTTFILCDFLIFLRILLRNYGEPLKTENIRDTVLVLGIATILLFLLKKILILLEQRYK
ncbi:hypothetical protein BST86_13495 [Nonlabens agnitus]|uniref:Uncharacterized protein n=1 Tax=Nonlabens agnitus TaxID=870484 RepID=A0A2S9WX57_9FLAO|nr:hypothetical protein BST86_13495 [Nonlabens agnitus]